MPRTRAKALWVATESTFDTDPDNSGAAYVSVPALELGNIQDLKDPLESNYFTGRPFPTEAVQGTDAWQLEITVPVIGNSAEAGDGDSPPSEDWLDKLLENALGTQGTTDGEGIASSTSSTVTINTTSVLAEQDLFPTYTTALDHPQWRLVTDDASDPALSVAPNWDSNPTSSEEVYGTRYYAMTSAFSGGTSLSFVYDEDDVRYVLTGGQVVGATLIGEVGQMLRMTLTIMGAGKESTFGSHASLPVQAAAPAVTPLKAICAPVYFNGTEYATRRFEIDFGLSANHIEATSSCTGKTGTEVLGASATVTIEPLRSDANLELKRNVTTGRLLVTLGGGAPSGGVLNTAAVHFGNAYAQSVEITDDNGRLRQAIQFNIVDGGDFESSGTAAEYFRIARA